jgi:hypothetical protein
LNNKRQHRTISHKLILMIIVACLIKDANAQKRCITINSLINEYYKGNQQLAILDKNFKIKWLTYQNDLEKWKISSRVDATLPYSKSIESVLQPDGNAIFTQRQFLSPNLNVTTFKKIPKTGGEIGISGSLGYFKNFKNNNQQFSANWFNISISQPLFAYNEFQFERTKQALNFGADSIQYLKDREAKLKDFMSKVIEYEVLKRKIENDENNMIDNKKALDKVKILYENGKMLSIDTLTLSNNIDQAKLNISKAQSELKFKQLALSYYFNRSYSLSICDFDELIIFQLDSVLLKENYLKYNNIQEIIIDSFFAFENIKKANKSHGITTSISAGIGANQSAIQFDRLTNTPSQRQNLAIATSVPLTGWQSYKRNKEIALLQQQVYESNKKDVYFLANEWINDKINTYNFLVKSYSFSTKKLYSLETILTTQLERLLAGKANTNEYNSTQLSINNVKIEQLEIIKEILLFRFEIRSLTLYDVELNQEIF